jgi:hypothetical protein
LIFCSGRKKETAIGIGQELANGAAGKRADAIIDFWNCVCLPLPAAFPLLIFPTLAFSPFSLRKHSSQKLFPKLVPDDFATARPTKLRLYCLKKPETSAYLELLFISNANFVIFLLNETIFEEFLIPMCFSSALFVSIKWKPGWKFNLIRADKNVE